MLCYSFLLAEYFAKSQNFLFLVFDSGYTDLCCPKIFPCFRFTVISSWWFFFTTTGALFPLDFIQVCSFRQICRPGLILPLRFHFVSVFGCQWVRLSACASTEFRCLGARRQNALRRSGSPSSRFHSSLVWCCCVSTDG
jgi:hypothetical protein